MAEPYVNQREAIVGIDLAGHQKVVRRVAGGGVACSRPPEALLYDDVGDVVVAACEVPLEPEKNGTMLSVERIVRLTSTSIFGTV